MFRLLPSDQARLKDSRARFVEGAPLPSALLSESVARSWERARQAGLRPWQSAGFAPKERLVHPVATDTDRKLRHAVHGEIEPLWSAFGGPQWALFCVNAQGIVVDARQSAMVADPALRPLQVGQDVSEGAIGTTAPACALRDGTETIVEGNQHFLAAFEDLFCLSVPLRGTEGDVIGALDITGRGERDVEMLRQHFRYAALAVELRMIETLGQCHLLRLQPDPRLMDSPMAGMLAVDNDGCLRAASLMARRTLGLPAVGALRGITLCQLFPEATPAQKRRFLVAAATPQRILRLDGSHVWVQHTRLPVRGRTDRHTDEMQAPAAVVDTDWREQGLRAIADTLRAFDGNVAAAARHLHISRTTLYAKIRELRRSGLL